jgi:hypothetical protein
MDRRKFVIGLGSLAAGGAAATGTGAFSSVEAERYAAVGTTGDSSAFLALEGTGSVAGNSGYIKNDGTGDGELLIDMNGNSNPGGAGFPFNAESTVDYLFKITNKGTHEVEVDIKKMHGAGSAKPELPKRVELYASPSTDVPVADPYDDTASNVDRIDVEPDGTNDGTHSVTLGVGKSVHVSMFVDTMGLSHSDMPSSVERLIQNMEVRAESTATPGS